MSYAGQQYTCPDPECAHVELVEPGQDPPSECAGCGREVTWTDWLTEAEPVHDDELEDFDR